MARRQGTTTDAEAVAVSFDPRHNSDYVTVRGSVENTGDNAMNCLFDVSADANYRSKFGISIGPGASIRFDSHFLPYGPASGPFTGLDIIVQSVEAGDPTSYKIKYEEA